MERFYPEEIRNIADYGGNLGRNGRSSVLLLLGLCYLVAYDPSLLEKVSDLDIDELAERFHGNQFLYMPGMEFPENFKNTVKILVVFSNYLYYWRRNYWIEIRKAVQDSSEDNACRYKTLYNAFEWEFTLAGVMNDEEERAYTLSKVLGAVDNTWKFYGCKEEEEK